MKVYNQFCDPLYDEICAFCGEVADTRDHVPSKILLDEPYSENLPVVPCCHKCNNDFSKHEEYFACAIECCKYMTTDLSKLKRIKVIKALEHNPRLKNQIEESIVISKDSSGNNCSYFNFDSHSLNSVIIKLAKGHAKFEHSTPFFDPPKQIFFNCLSSLSDEEKTIFYTIPIVAKSAEIGSRSSNFILQNTQGGSVHISMWETVQNNHYQYLVHYNDINDCTEVRIELADYFYIQVNL